jgi:hypothetical protein
VIIIGLGFAIKLFGKGFVAVGKPRELCWLVFNFGWIIGFVSMLVGAKFKQFIKVVLCFVKIFASIILISNCLKSFGVVNNFGVVNEIIIANS